MCGIIGYVAGKDFDRRYAGLLFRNLLLMDERRGRDSTGFLRYDAESGVLLLKKAPVRASEWLLNEDVHERLSDAFERGRVFLGHNRAATRGRVDARRAHPIVARAGEARYVALSHNGGFPEAFVTRCGEILRERRGEGWFRREFASIYTVSDTEAFTYRLALAYEDSGDLVESLAELLREAELSGGFPGNASYALLVLEIPSGELYFVRNEKRPGFAVTVPSGPIAGTWIVSDPKIFSDAYLPLVGVGPFSVRFVSEVLSRIREVEPWRIFRVTEEGLTEVKDLSAVRNEVERRRAEAQRISLDHVLGRPRRQSRRSLQDGFESMTYEYPEYSLFSV